ncbi:LysR substrate binding domain-containing protein [Asanoa hainanensis]|uniref:LysR substrate binding domain-containing protein n=2 Tax=Asanoa hainanensis TaxID=560556 RepID=A0A239NH96_9ACTN|nr:LysR substrate binding domain-containing protein [Asanoa hainanensis]
MGCPALIGARLGTQGLPHVDLPAILGRFHESHPQVVIRLRGATGGSTAQLVEVVGGGLDLALVGTIERPAGIRLFPLGSVRCCLVCSGHNPLAGATSVTLADLAHETFVDFPVGWGIRTLVDRAFALAGVVRDVPFEAADQASALALVRNNLGVAFLPREGSETPETAVVDVTGVDLDLSVALATPADRSPSPVTAALVHAILAAAGDATAT